MEDRYCLSDALLLAGVLVAGILVGFMLQKDVKELYEWAMRMC